MKEILKYLGVLVMLAGVIMLAVIVTKGVMRNTGLGVSLLLVIAGMIGYILMNRKLE